MKTAIIKIMASVVLIMCSTELFATNLRDDSDFTYMLFIEPGTIWETEVKDLSNADENTFIIKQWLEDKTEVDGKTYFNLWTSIDGAQEDLTTLIRTDYTTQSVYALDPNNKEFGERLIYCFLGWNTPKEIAFINWDGTLSDIDYVCEFKEYGDKLTLTDHATVNTYILNVSTKGEENKTESLGNVTWIYGIGSPAGFLNQLYCLESGYQTTLLKVSSHGDGVVYENNQGSIKNINTTKLQDGKKYHLDGTPFGEKDKGIYILNGKKYIRK